ncbi:MAG TPA: triose-phosphate isomerase [Candidatus Babeliales bacterium]|jgi:triosephosphate isomerase|nr:triose-phosphate isomerase [Candidatus Babeliales bacterium]
MKYIYVANWKMNLSFNQSISFCTNNINALQQLSNNTAHIVICPSFDAIASITDIFKQSSIAIGAQNCSEHSSGAYTGEVSVQSLADIGITYCLVGHSERRMYYGDTTEKIMKKIDLLLRNNIVPIICIGETQEDFLNKKTFTTLTQQLEPIIQSLSTSNYQQVIIAYEPIWSIGTGIIPTIEQLTATFLWLAERIQLSLPNQNIQLLYGGSVSKNNSAALKKIPHITGFLIGGASTDFEQLKNIIIL